MRDNQERSQLAMARKALERESWSERLSTLKKNRKSFERKGWDFMNWWFPIAVSLFLSLRVYICTFLFHLASNINITCYCECTYT
jgi:hypothetical protein